MERAVAAAAACLLVACATPGVGGDGEIDLTVVLDATSRFDHATTALPDLTSVGSDASAAVQDLGFADLAVADLTAAVDRVTLPDLRVVADQSRPPDLSVVFDLATPPDLIPVPPARSQASPGVSPDPFWGGAYARAHRLTLASDDPTARIYYTTNGSAPTLTSPNAVTPVAGLLINSPSTTVRWFASNGGGDEIAHNDVYAVDVTLQNAAGFVIEDTVLDGVSPTVVATPGQVLTLARATYQVWVQSACPACGAQLVYGVDTTDQGCLYSNSPGLYPGTTGTNVSFTITAPLTSGFHEVRVAHIEQTSCAAAMASKALLNRPSQGRIGVLYVK